jgi:hypothetical protein
MIVHLITTHLIIQLVNFLIHRPKLSANLDKGYNRMTIEDRTPPKDHQNSLIAE